MSNIITNSGGFSLAEHARRIQNRKQLWAQVLRTNQHGQVINNASTLHYDDYKDLQTDVLKAREFDNTGVNDLRAAGLTRASSIGKTLVQYENMNTFDAKISMNGSNREENRSNYQEAYVPQPIFHTDYTIGWRNEGFSYKQSDGIMESVFRVQEKQDEALFLGAANLGVFLAGSEVPLYGYTTHPDRVTSTILNWATDTGDNITADAVQLIGKMFTDNRVATPDSVVIYVANDVWPNLENDYASAKGDRTILERIKAITCVRDVKPSKHLADGDVVCVHMSADTVRWSSGSDVVAVPWVKGHDLEDGRLTVYACGTPIIKSDRNKRTGIVHGSKA